MSHEEEIILGGGDDRARPVTQGSLEEVEEFAAQASESVRVEDARMRSLQLPSTSSEGDGEGKLWTREGGGGQASSPEDDEVATYLLEVETNSFLKRTALQCCERCAWLRMQDRNAALLKNNVFPSQHLVVVGVLHDGA